MKGKVLAFILAVGSFISLIADVAPWGGRVDHDQRLDHGTADRAKGR